MSDPVGYNFRRVPFGAPQQKRDASRYLERSRRGRSSQPGAGGIVEVRCDHQYANLIDVSVGIELVSIKVLDAPAGLRNLLAFRNGSTGAQVIFLGFGRDATSFSTFAIQPNQVLLFDEVVPQDDVYAVSNIAGGLLSLAYSVIPEV